MSLKDISKEDDLLVRGVFGRITFSSTFLGIIHLNKDIEQADSGKSPTPAQLDVNKWLVEKLSEIVPILEQPQWKRRFHGLDLIDSALGDPFVVNLLVEKAEMEIDLADKERWDQFRQEKIEEIKRRDTEGNVKVVIKSGSSGATQSLGEHQIENMAKKPEKN